MIAMFVLGFLSVPHGAVQAVSTNLVISQVYGGGGNSGATYKNDFVEIYNLGGTGVDVTGWTVQYASATGSTWQKTTLSGIIPSGGYYLVQEAAGAGGTVNLPTPDAVGVIAMAASNGKVALVDNDIALAGSCPTTVIDFVGFGTANCSETAPTAAISNTTAALRKSDGALDTDNNSTDFEIGVPNPRNSSYPFSAIGAANPSMVIAGQTSLLTVEVTPAPTSSGIAVTCDLSSIGGSASQPLYDDGTNGDAIASDLVFSFATEDTVAGSQSVACTFSDLQGNSGIVNITLTLLEIIPIGVVQGSVSDVDTGATFRSPFAPATGNGAGQRVTIQGVIFEKTIQPTASGGYNGFFVQNSAATADADDLSSDGIYVYMSTNSSIPTLGGSTYVPAVGDEVVITGTVSEYYNMTELSNVYLIGPVLRSGIDLDTEIVTPTLEPPDDLLTANIYWERLEGMRVRIPADSIVLGGRSAFSPPDGEVWVATPTSTIALRTDPYERRAFRDAHPLDDNYDPTTWDGNGYRILMGSWGVKADAEDPTTLIDPARTFDAVTSSPVGGLNYTFNKYRVEVSTQPIYLEGVDPAANMPPTAIADRTDAYSIVDYNLENVYDFRNNPFSGCDFEGDSGCAKVDPFLSAVTPPYDYVPASDEVYQARLTDIATQIIEDLHQPDILMVQEVENQDICSVDQGILVCGIVDNADGKPDVLQELALKIASLGGAAYDAAFDRDSSDLRGIAPAYMYRTDRVELLPAVGDPVLGEAPAVNYAGASVAANSDISNPKTLNAVLPAGVSACETSWVFPRAASVALFRIHANGMDDTVYNDVYVINNHFKSGPDSCVAHRTEQAKYNAALIGYIEALMPSARIVMGGDLNVYPRPDDTSYGASDQLGSLYDPALGLTNLWETLLAESPAAAYSYVYMGTAQTLDQMFINQPLMSDLKEFRIAHINSDFPADYAGDVARGTSDHDPNVATFGFAVAPQVTSIDPGEIQAGGSSFTLTVNGSGFTADSIVQWNGADRPTTFVDNGHLTAQITASDIATMGTADVSVLLSTVSDLESNAMSVKIYAFADVLPGSWYYAYVQGFYGAQMTTGCNIAPFRFCPDRAVTRAETAVFILRVLNGSDYVPPALVDPSSFSDVPVAGKEWMAPWIEEFYSEGMTTGCATSPFRFCPEREVTRAEMAVFILRAIHGTSYLPPAVAESSFSDVPVSGKEWMMPWIEQFYNEGFTTGCKQSPSLQYCPEQTVTRAEVATFLSRAFDIPVVP